MAGLSGIDTARKIRERDKLAALVFVTASVSHAIESHGMPSSVSWYTRNDLPLYDG